LAKVEALTSLGIEFDTIKMELRLPGEEVVEIKNNIMKLSFLTKVGKMDAAIRYSAIWY
jgi:hypothetical protein